MACTVVSLSGGMDSAVTLALALNQQVLHAGFENTQEWRNENFLTVGFHYGSKHNKHEQIAAINLAHHYQVPYQIIDLSNIMSLHTHKSSLLSDGPEVPHGHYEAETMRSTVVPARNMIFASILTSLAASRGSLERGEVFLGIHAGDHFIYPDCRPDFYTPMAQAVYFGTDKLVDLSAPFLGEDKSYIVSLGLKLGVPFHLTRTCYEDHPVACGKCGSCTERREAFAKNAVKDPVEYRS